MEFYIHKMPYWSLCKICQLQHKNQLLVDILPLLLGPFSFIARRLYVNLKEKEAHRTSVKLLEG